MSEDAETHMCSYVDLNEDEKEKLQSIDKEVALFAIQTLGLSMRPAWMGMQTSEGRFIELRVASQESPFCSIPEHVVKIMSASQIIGGLNAAFAKD